MTNEDNFHDVLKTIKQNLQSWLDETFQGIYDRPDEFPEIRVTARVADDDSSVGDCSYYLRAQLATALFKLQEAMIKQQRTKVREAEGQQVMLMRQTTDPRRRDLLKPVTLLETLSR